VEVLREQGPDIAADRGAWHVPPADLLFLQRKISGVALLAVRMNARVNLRPLLSTYMPINGVTES
jgi:hypothetical protein